MRSSGEGPGLVDLERGSVPWLLQDWLSLLCKPWAVAGFGELTSPRPWQEWWHSALSYLVCRPKPVLGSGLVRAWGLGCPHPRLAFSKAGGQGAIASASPAGQGKRATAYLVFLIFCFLFIFFRAEDET